MMSLLRLSLAGVTMTLLSGVVVYVFTPREVPCQVKLVVRGGTLPPYPGITSSS